MKNTNIDMDTGIYLLNGNVTYTRHGPYFDERLKSIQYGDDTDQTEMLMRNDLVEPGGPHYGTMYLGIKEEDICVEKNYTEADYEKKIVETIMFPAKESMDFDEVRDGTYKGKSCKIYTLYGKEIYHLYADENNFVLKVEVLFGDFPVSSSAAADYADSDSGSGSIPTSSSGSIPASGSGSIPTSSSGSVHTSSSSTIASSSIPFFSSSSLASLSSSSSGPKPTGLHQNVTYAYEYFFGEIPLTDFDFEESTTEQCDKRIYDPPEKRICPDHSSSSTASSGTSSKHHSSSMPFKSSSISGGSEPENNTVGIVVGVIGAVCLVLIAAGVIIFLVRRKKQNATRYGPINGNPDDPTQPLMTPSKSGYSGYL